MPYVTPTEFVQVMRERYETGSQFQIADRIVQLEDLRTAVTIIEQLQTDVQTGAENLLRAVDEIDYLERMLQASNQHVLEQGRTIRGAMQQLRSSGGQKSGADGVLLPVGLPTAMEEGNDGVYHRQTYASRHEAEAAWLADDLPDWRVI